MLYFADFYPENAAGRLSGASGFQPAADFDFAAAHRSSEQVPSHTLCPGSTSHRKTG